MKKKENVHPTKELEKGCCCLVGRKEMTSCHFPPPGWRHHFCFYFFRLWWWLKFFNIIISSTLFYFFFSLPRHRHRYTRVLVVETVQSALVCRAVRSFCFHRFLKTKNLFLKEEVGFYFNPLFYF